MAYKKYSREEDFARYDLESPEAMFGPYFSSLDPKKDLSKLPSQYRDLTFGISPEQLPLKYRKPMFSKSEDRLTIHYFKFLIRGLKFVHKLHFLNNQLVALEALCRESSRLVLDELLESAYLNYDCEAGKTCFTPQYAFRLETKLGLRFLYFGNQASHHQMVGEFLEAKETQQIIKEVTSSHLLKFQTII